MASAVAGCAHYEPRPISVEQGFDDFEARQLESPELAAFVGARQESVAWPPTAWGLAELSWAAFYFSPELDLARAQWGVAEGGVLTAGGPLDPAVRLALGYNASSAADVSPWIPEGALDLPLDIAGKRGIQVTEARHVSQAARLNLLHAAWLVRSRVRQSLLALFVARESAALLQRQQDIQARTIQILEARLAAGEASPTEVTRARVDLANSRVAALSATQAAAQARAGMADAIGVAPGALDDVSIAFEELSRVGASVPTAEVRRRALVGRADILAGLEEYEASQSALQLEVRRQYPDITLGPGYQLDQTDSKWTLGLGIALPLFSRNRGPIAEAAARREEAAARFLVLQSRVLGEVDVAVSMAESAVTQLAAADTLLEALARQEAAATTAYDVGEISMLELLGLQAEATATSLARLDALARAQEALGALEDAMQTPLDVEPWVLEAPERASSTAEAPR